MDTKKTSIPNVDPYLFWDVDQWSMDWQSRSAARWILRRVVERGGNEADFNALVDFYGLGLLQDIGCKLTDLRFPFMCEKLTELLGLPLNQMQCYTNKQSRAERLISLWS